MQRPNSIVLFERSYLAAWALGIVNTAVNWSRVQGDANVAAASAQIGSWYVPTMTAIGFLIPLLLWYFIARRGSVVAKWIMVVFTAFGVAALLFSAATGRFPGGIGAVISIVAVVLNVFAASRLFQGDVRAWFGETPAEPA